MGRQVIELEARAVARLGELTGPEFAEACHLIMDCAGRVVVTGMGKSGHVGSKIAATLASTGTPAFFVHPGEASHGDLGMIIDGDLVMAISNSGETPEILTILPIIKRLGVKLIALTGNQESTLAAQADVSVDVSVEQEACPLNLAPTASTTATLAMGDAIAVALYQARGFTESDFARSHPGGALGRRLLLYVDDLMHTGDHLPLVQSGDPLRRALVEMSGKGMGMTGVVDDDQRLLGIFTDGDLRRSLERGENIYECAIESVMTRDPYSVRAGTLAAEVIQMMRTRSINAVFVIDGQDRVCGALNMHDLLRAGVM
ncbi:MAG: KpsF/GutQ family sugar-phosphate isomerase [Gammaproteobacteria bacterium]|nr:KpsF/GutQ family sugar-phosphate isomerase [Gammaproteobacteria bacterium]